MSECASEGTIHCLASREGRACGRDEWGHFGAPSVKDHSQRGRGAGLKKTHKLIVFGVFFCVFGV